MPHEKLGTRPRIDARLISLMSARIPCVRDNIRVVSTMRPSHEFVTAGENPFSREVLRRVAVFIHMPVG